LQPSTSRGVPERGSARCVSASVQSAIVPCLLKCAPQRCAVGGVGCLPCGLGRDVDRRGPAVEDHHLVLERRARPDPAAALAGVDADRPGAVGRPAAREASVDGVEAPLSQVAREVGVSATGTAAFSHVVALAFVVLSFVLLLQSRERIATLIRGPSHGPTSAAALVGLSAVAALPGLVGVAAGQRLRRRLPERYVTAGAFLLLAVIGTKLLADGAAGL